MGASIWGSIVLDSAGHAKLWEYPGHKHGDRDPLHQVRDWPSPRERKKASSRYTPKLVRTAASKDSERTLPRALELLLFSKTWRPSVENNSPQMTGKEGHGEGTRVIRTRRFKTTEPWGVFCSHGPGSHQTGTGSRSRGEQPKTIVPTHRTWMPGP